MDYGYDREFECAKRREMRKIASKRRRRHLARQCAAVIIVYTIIAISGLAALQVRQALAPPSFDSGNSGQTDPTINVTTVLRPAHPGR